MNGHPACKNWRGNEGPGKFHLAVNDFSVAGCSRLPHAPAIARRFRGFANFQCGTNELSQAINLDFGRT